MSQGLTKKKRNTNFYEAQPSANRHILNWQTLSFLSVIILDLLALSILKYLVFKHFINIIFSYTEKKTTASSRNSLYITQFWICLVPYDMTDFLKKARMRKIIITILKSWYLQLVYRQPQVRAVKVCWGLKMDLLNLSPFLFPLLQIQQTIISLLKRK